MQLIVANIQGGLYPTVGASAGYDIARSGADVRTDTDTAFVGLTLNVPTTLEHFPYVQKELVLRWPDNTTEAVLLSGTAAMQITIDADGTAADTDGDGLDQVPTELVALDLAGNSSAGNCGSRRSTLRYSWISSVRTRNADFGATFASFPCALISGRKRSTKLA